MPRTAHESAVLRSFGARVRAKREALGWSQEDLAAESGLHRTYVSALERGRRNVGLLNVAAIARALGCRPAELVG